MRGLVVNVDYQTHLREMYKEHRLRVDTLKTDLEAWLYKARMSPNQPSNMAEVLQAAEELVAELRKTIVDLRAELDRIQRELSRTYE